MTSQIKNLLLLTMFLLLACLTLGNVHATLQTDDVARDEVSRPNVIVILADDIGEYYAEFAQNRQ